MPAARKRGSDSRSNRVRKPRKAQQPETQKSVPPHRRLLHLIVGFLNDAECAQDMFATVIPVLRKQDKKLLKHIEETVRLLHKDAHAEGPQRTRVMRHARTLAMHAQKLTRADTMFRGSALVGLVSRYDEFLSSILKTAYATRPGRATAPDKTLTYDDLLTLDSLDNVGELFIAKEIDTLLRDSHKKQLETIDKEFKTGIMTEFPEVPQWIEIMERRNLLVHAGGIASKYYVRQCGEGGYEKDSVPEQGAVLGVDDDYFHASVLCLSELAVRLGYALAFRLHPDKLDDIHGHLREEVGFPLLMSEQWELARRVFSFALSLPKQYIGEDETVRLCVVRARDKISGAT